MIRFLLLIFFISFPFLNADNWEDVFSNIYNSAHWGINREGHGTSGIGSTFENTTPYRTYLQDFLELHEIETVLDIGCGDWEFSQFIDWEKVRYMGIDVVQSVIENNELKYGSLNKKFIHGNFLFIDLPEADLLICKDVLQHLSNENILSFIPQLSKYKHCLITNDVDPESLTSGNYDIPSGSYRLLDLTQSPFNIKGEKVLHYNGGGTIKQVIHIKRDP